MLAGFTFPLYRAYFNKLPGSVSPPEEARRLMAQHHLDRILVVEGDRLVGIISEADIRSDEAPLA